MSRDYLERILLARVYDVAVETALDPAPNLSARLGNTLLLKREDAQPVFSFKVRGAYNTKEYVARTGIEGKSLVAIACGANTNFNRLLVGGHAELARDELVYRFEFPERPGARLRFLEAMQGGWNISLFHYRNDGADSGRVLVGMQVPRREMPAFRRFLARVGYPYVDESANPAYPLFLG